MVIVIESVFHEGSKYYPEVFLDEYLYKLVMLEYDRVDMPVGIDLNKTYGCTNLLFAITGTFSR